MTKCNPGGFATATPATPATISRFFAFFAPGVAGVAGVAVAQWQKYVFLNHQIIGGE